MNQIAGWLRQVDAQRCDVLWGVIREALLVASIGIVAGLLATLAGARVVTSPLFGVAARDPLTLSAAATLLVVTTLLAVTLLAAYIPARRASQIDPVLVLRAE